MTHQGGLADLIGLRPMPPPRGGPWGAPGGPLGPPGLPRAPGEPQGTPGRPVYFIEAPLGGVPPPKVFGVGRVATRKGV